MSCIVEAYHWNQSIHCCQQNLLELNVLLQIKTHFISLVCFIYSRFKLLYNFQVSLFQFFFFLFIFLLGSCCHLQKTPKTSMNMMERIIQGNMAKECNLYSFWDISYILALSLLTSERFHTPNNINSMNLKLEAE